MPPFSGFWSKDEILAGVWGYNKVLWVLLLVAAFLTAFYMSRLMFLTFFGQPRWSGEVHESPRLMTVPLVVLAVLATAAGVLNLPFTHSVEFLGRWLEPSLASHAGELGFAGGTKWVLAGAAILAAAAGVFAAKGVYLGNRIAPEVVERKLFVKAWGYDDAISSFVSGRGRRLFDSIARFDSAVVDGAVKQVAALPRRAGVLLRRAQSGFVRRYALALSFGALGLLIYFLVKAGV